MATLTISVYPSDTACSHTWRESRDWRLPYLGHRSPLGTHSQPVAGILHVAAGDGEVGDVVGAEEGGPHLELAVGGVGVLPGQQTGLTQRLNTVTVSITETFCWTLTLQSHLILPTIKPKKLLFQNYRTFGIWPHFLFHGRDKDGAILELLTRVSVSSLSREVLMVVVFISLLCFAGDNQPEICQHSGFSPDWQIIWFMMRLVLTLYLCTQPHVTVVQVGEPLDTKLTTVLNTLSVNTYLINWREGKDFLHYVTLPDSWAAWWEITVKWHQLVLQLELFTLEIKQSGCVWGVRGKHRQN